MTACCREHCRVSDIAFHPKGNVLMMTGLGCLLTTYVFAVESCFCECNLKCIAQCIDKRKRVESTDYQLSESLSLSL